MCCLDRATLCILIIIHICRLSCCCQLLLARAENFLAERDLLLLY